MAEILLQQINGEDLTGHVEIIPNTIVWRESAGRFPHLHHHRSSPSPLIAEPNYSTASAPN